METHVTIRRLGRRDYEPVWRAMQRFTDERSEATVDEIWQVEHPPVFTLGMNGKPEHLLSPGDIPVVSIDRGGQVTYHGPGQVVIYLMIDIRRRKLGIRNLVEMIEQAIIELLADCGIEGYGRRDAPGVYVDQKKIAALGLRVRRGCTYHGLALNVDMDLTPYQRINPCGYAGMEVTQLADLDGPTDWQAVADALCQKLAKQLNYTALNYVDAQDDE